MYVANQVGDTVSVIDTSTHSVIATIIVGDSPYDIIAAPDGSRVYVANGAGTVSVIDTLTNAVIATVDLGRPIALAIDVTPNGSHVYVVRSGNGGAGTVAVIDTSTNAVITTIPVGNQANGIAIGGAPQPFSVSSLSPPTGQNTGYAPVVIRGSGFMGGATVQLVRQGQPSIFGASTTIDPSLIVTRFDLRQAEVIGPWDVLVRNPDGASVLLAQAFEITFEVVPDTRLWVDILGARAYRRDDYPVSLDIAYGNGGTEDAIFVPLWIALPKVGSSGRPVSFEIASEIAEPLPSDELEGVDLDYAQWPLHIETEEELLIPLWIPNLRSGESGVVRLYVNPQGSSLKVSAWAGLPLLRKIGNPIVGPVLSEEALCTYAIAEFLGETLFDVINPVPIGFIYSSYREITEKYDKYEDQAIPRGMLHVWAALILVREAALEGFGELVPLSDAVLSAVLEAYKIMHHPNHPCYKVVNAFFDPRSKDRTNSESLFAALIASLDPNDKVGARRVGGEGYISEQEPLLYKIMFENLAEATAPAQEIVITDDLDVKTMDLETLTLGNIAFGNKVVVPPSGVKEFATQVDLRPETSLLVNIDARLARSTGRMTWHFTSVDPDTGKTPPDLPATAGFLPPNLIPPQGEGSVLFTIRPRTGLTTGTKVSNQASIIFDPEFDGPIVPTPQWLNTLDNTPPASRVLPLAAVQPSNRFQVQWSGTDVGSGVADYTIFVAEDGGPFRTWLRQTTETSALFPGEPNKIYAFSSLARDQTGNREDKPLMAEATTATQSGPQHVVLDIQPDSVLNRITISRDPNRSELIPVAILTTATFDATTVDPTTVRFGKTGTEAAPVQTAREDADGDSRLDLVLSFQTRDTGLRCGDTSASLTGQTMSGQAIQGVDTIMTVQGDAICQ
jgi:YVTN family beta-propeller protein